MPSFLFIYLFIFLVKKEKSHVPFLRNWSPPLPQICLLDQAARHCLNNCSYLSFQFFQIKLHEIFSFYLLYFPPPPSFSFLSFYPFHLLKHFFSSLKHFSTRRFFLYWKVKMSLLKLMTVRQTKGPWRKDQGVTPGGATTAQGSFGCSSPQNPQNLGQRNQKQEPEERAAGMLKEITRWHSLS